MASVRELKQWSKCHEDMDKVRFNDLAKDIERLEKN